MASGQHVDRSTQVNKYLKPSEYGKRPTMAICTWSNFSVGSVNLPKTGLLQRETLAVWQPMHVRHQFATSLFISCHMRSVILRGLVALWGPATGVLLAGEAGRECELTSCFLPPGLTARRFCFFHHLQTRMRSDRRWHSVTSGASYEVEAISLSETKMCARNYMSVNWDNKPEKERKIFLRCFINKRCPGR